MTTGATSGASGQTAGLPWLSRGLIAYGLIGLVVAAIGLGAMVWVNGRISSLRTDIEASVAGASNTISLSATVLRGASTTVQSFSGTADEVRQAVSAAAVAITEVHSELSGVEAQLRSVNIFGATPLSSSADAVGQIAASLDGLATQIPVVADGLAGNRDALAANATSLGRLADSTAALAARLGPSTGQDSLAGTQQVIAVTLLMFAAWSFVPACGALALGLWLRRELARSRSKEA
ncbi:MAG: hypothetical protein ABI573_03290 [Chloroflexota bacterium]